MNKTKRKPILLTIHLGHTFNDLEEVSKQLELLDTDRIT